MAAELIETPVIVGTAGHVDHGKSALVKALTGTDPDRLPQEKSRGITIDLGFAELDLPSGRVVGLVDVPGHGHYVRAMVAGATGVDVALLVVAADDGVMPQTREHVRILELLGVRLMVVALTKADLVDEEMLELAQADVEDYLAGTAFAGAHVIPVSSKTGLGVSDIASELDRLVDEFLATGQTTRRAALPARLPVDRVFNVEGVGTVVTGTTATGGFCPGDAVEVYPSGVRGRVRTVQVHDRDVAQALAGQRTALNLTGISVDQVPRGSTVAQPDTLSPCDRFDASLHWLGRDGHEKPLKTGDRVHVCAGTAQVLGRILLFDGQETLDCGENALVQIRLEEPLVMRPHDRFVIMSYSPVELVAGGEALLVSPARRTKLSNDEHELLDAIVKKDDNRAIWAYLRDIAVPVTREQISDTLGIASNTVGSELAELVDKGGIMTLTSESGGGRWYVDNSALERSIDALVERLSQDCVADDSQGVPTFTLRDEVFPRMADDIFAALIGLGQARGSVAYFGANLAPCDRVEAMAAYQNAIEEPVMRKFSELGVGVPLDSELAQTVDLSISDFRRALRGLEDRGLIQQIAKGYHLSSAALDIVRDKVADCIRSHGGGAVASDLRDAIGVSRKYAIPLLEYLDKTGVTQRDSSDPNVRRLKGE